MLSSENKGIIIIIIIIIIYEADLDPVRVRAGPDPCRYLIRLHNGSLGF